MLEEDESSERRTLVAVMLHRHIYLLWTTSLALVATIGCQKPVPPASPVAEAPAAAKQPPPAKQPVPAKPAVAPTQPTAVPKPPQVVAPSKATTPPVAPAPPAFVPDVARLAAGGFRRIAGKHLTLFTDHPADAEVDALPEWFDQAMRFWRSYFIHSGERVPDSWHMTGYLIVDKDRARQAGALAADLPPFQHGYARGQEIWLYEQPSAYYRRHLLLHEGTHAFMQQACGGLGPPWYAEGVAELLPTHQVRNGKLILDVFPPSRDDVPHWGRIKLIQDAVASGRRLTIEEVMNFGPSAHQDTEAYAWSWALAVLLSRGDGTASLFTSLQRQVATGQLDKQLMQGLTPKQWTDLRDNWAVFIDEINYGLQSFDLVGGMNMGFLPNPSIRLGTEYDCRADQVWQPSGIELGAGKKYRLRATGRCHVAAPPDGKSWESEPGGISVRYYRGRPLGQLLAVVRPREADAKLQSVFLQPMVVGLETVIEPKVDGMLYLRINDSPSELIDNNGHYRVTVTPE